MIFNLSEKHSRDIYNLISNQVKQDLPLNIGLIFSKYINKFVTGYFENQKWVKGEQSEIKRQIYLIKKERVEALDELIQIRNRKGNIIVKVKERGKSRQKKILKKQLQEILDPIIDYLEKSNVDEAIKKLSDIVGKIQNRNISQELKQYLVRITNIRLDLPPLFDTNLYKVFCNRMDHLLNTLKVSNHVVEEKEYELSWRLLINLGAASVYETSLLFHRNYSIPYIPGSAVKGITRHWAIQKFAKNSGKSPEDIDSALSKGEDLGISVDSISFVDLIEIFGAQDKKGKVIFFDALPILKQNKAFIVLDVMNVHYKRYYEGKETPGDWHNPTPVFFLAVERGTRFRFSLASKDGKIIDKTVRLLEEALKNIGIGAKTSAGYGYFEV